MSTRAAISIIFCICIVSVKAQVRISQTPSIFVEGETGAITCTADVDTEEIKITRNSTSVLTCVSFDRSTCNHSADYLLSTSAKINVTLSIPQLSRNRDEGQWKCLIQNSSASLNLDVNVPVSSIEIENKAKLSFVDGITQIIKCKVQPVAVKPPPNITWKIDGVVKSTEISDEYSYKAAKSDNKKSLECLAENSIGPAKTDTLVLNVKYIPVVSIEPSISPYKIIEGNNVKFTCSYDANPTPTEFNVFSSSRTRSFSGQVVPISKISRNSTGAFFCMVTNTVGNGTSKDIEVDVLYPPTIQLRSENRVIENSAFSIDCDVDSKPPANTVSWKNTNGRTLKFANISQADSGIYTCTASNTMVPSVGSAVTGRDTKTTRVNVLYGPEVIVLKESIEVIEFRNLKTSCTVGSNPPAKIKWLSPDNRVLSQTADLELNNVNRTNAGNYTCKGTVTFNPTSGSGVTRTASKVTSITVLHVPKTPTKLLFVNSTDTTICVKWEADFNGGRDQNFTIQYSIDNKTWIDSQQIPERTNTKELGIWSKELSYCLRNLSPDTEYSVRIFPQNLVGKSEYVYFQPACCKPIRTQIQITADDDSAVIGLAVGLCLVSVIAVLAILASIVFYRRFNKVSKKGSIYASTELAARESRHYADLGLPADGGVQYENYVPKNMDAENVYVNQSSSTNQSFVPDNEMNFETFIGKTVDSRNQDHKEKNVPPQYPPDERNYENLPTLPRANNPPNIYENYKGKQKRKDRAT